MNVIESLIKQKQFKIYIHPIPPVLDPTRPIVVKYNEIYKREVDKLKARGLSVKWLDFFNEFIDSGKSGLRDEYKLDGTHLHPKYLELIEKEF
jgi:lysophospholipase L1-like esterase